MSKISASEKARVISAAGKGCFDDDSLTAADRDRLFGIAAGYLSDENSGDRHIVTQICELAKTILQTEKIDRCINAQLSSEEPDAALISKLSGVKSTLLGSVSSLAAEVGASSKKDGGKRKTGSLTAIMKEMSDALFDDAKPNAVSARLSLAYREIARQNARALTEELNLTGDEFAQMTAAQAETIRLLREKCLQLEEKIRLLRAEAKKGGDTASNDSDRP